MRKLLLGVFFIIAVFPLILSFAAKYYLQHQFVTNFAADIEVRKLKFDHGWFSSGAELELTINDQNIIVSTDNHIQQGPILWETIFSNPINSFALYKIDTKFDLLNQRNGAALSNQAGSATTLINYLGNSRPSIAHPGLDLSILQTQVFADLAQIDSEIKTDGTVFASIKTNQLQLSANGESLYLVEPELKIAVNPEQPLPQKFELNAISLSSLFNTNQYDGGGIKLTSELKQSDGAYELNASLFTEQLNINQALTTDLDATFSVSNLDQQVLDFIAINFDSISQSIQNSQWLVFLKHFSDLLKLIDTNQPELFLSLQGQAKNQPIKLDFTSELLTDKETQLNPFSLLENLEMKLETELPIEFISKLEQPQTVEFLQSMLEKGLLIKKINRIMQVLVSRTPS